MVARAAIFLDYSKKIVTAADTALGQIPALIAWSIENGYWMSEMKDGQVSWLAMNW